MVTLSEVHRYFSYKTPNINFTCTLGVITENLSPQKINKRKYNKNFNKLVQNVKELHELSKLKHDTNEIIKSKHCLAILFITITMIVVLSLYLLI